MLLNVQKQKLRVLNSYLCEKNYYLLLFGHYGILKYFFIYFLFSSEIDFGNISVRSFGSIQQ